MKRELIALLVAPALALPACLAADTESLEEPVATETAAATRVTGHPRLWIRAAELPRLRSWATTANPMFAQGLLPAVKQAISTYDWATFALTTQAGCPWLAASTASFIWVSQPVSGTGSATLKVTVPANAGAARTGSVKVGGTVFTVSQAGAL